MEWWSAEQEWLLRATYPTALELKMVCQSPQRIQYLDMEVCHDAGGFHTVLYDKRDELRLEGKMGVVRRFPHPSPVLSEQCKYACLTSFMHRANCVCLRRKAFVQQVVQRVVGRPVWDIMGHVYSAHAVLHAALRGNRSQRHTCPALYHARFGLVLASLSLGSPCVAVWSCLCEGSLRGPMAVDVDLTLLTAVVRGPFRDADWPAFYIFGLPCTGGEIE